MLPRLHGVRPPGLGADGLGAEQGPFDGTLSLSLKIPVRHGAPAEVGPCLYIPRPLGGP